MKKQIKRTVSVLLSAIIVASLFAIVPIEVGAAGNSFSAASNYSLGNKVSGSITNSNTEDYYKFTLSSSGKINLIANSYMYWIYFRIYDTNHNQIKYWNPRWDSTTKVASTNETVDLVSGTYYFIVAKDGNTGNYDFRLNFTSANESFAESQGTMYNTYSNARSISLSSKYYGQIAENDDCDFYKFTLSSSGKINLIANSYMYWIYFRIYDTNHNQIKYWNPRWDSTTKVASTNETVDLVSGTYYFIVAKDGNTGNYDFRLNFTSANESFAESQGTMYNTYSNARSISLNSKYYGQIAENDESDFYKFTLSSSGKINLIANSYMKYICYRIYDSNYNQIKYWNPYWNSTSKVAYINESYTLNSGTYYFVVSKDNYTGNYNFNISKSSSSTTPSNPSIPSTQTTKPAAPTVSVANGVNGLDVAWGRVTNAKSYTVYYKTGSNSWSTVITSGTRVTLPKVQSGKFYYVQVQSIGANGVKGNYSKVKTMTYLSRANITSLTYNGSNTLKINAVPGANKYQIARLKSGDKSYTYFYTTSTTFTEKNAVGGIAYTYQVRAMYQTPNNGTAYGAWSATKSVPTLVAPTVTLTNRSNGIRATWNSIRGAIRYIVYYKKSTDKNWSSAVTTNLYYPILNTTRGATYYVQVRPVGSTVSTPYSSVKSIVYK